MMTTAHTQCGCGAHLHIEQEFGDLDVLLGHCRQWEEAHAVAENEMRRTRWESQVAAENIAAAFNGFSKMEVSDEVRLWAMGLQQEFMKLAAV